MKTLLLIMLLAVCAHAQSSSSINSTQPTYSGNFNFQYGPFDVNGEAHQDHVYRMGWNCGPGGSPVISGISAMCMEFEDHYRPGGPFDPREWKEFHVAGITRTGSMVRGMSFMFDESLGTWIQVFRSSNINFLDDSGSQTFQFVNGGVIVMNHAAIRSIDNNVNFLLQQSTTGTSIPVAKVNASNHVELGGGTVPVEVGTLILTNGGTPLTVTLGPSDSAGTGYRTLRAPN